MASWWDSLFGDVPMPARPTSRGALLGPGYQGMPNTQHIDDRRRSPTDYAAMMKHAPPAFDPQFSMPEYPPTSLGGDPTLASQTQAPPHPGYGFGASFLPPSSDLPSMSSHLPWAPGDPGWTPPPSLSGPHNRQGDPPRPGYDRPFYPVDKAISGMTLNSNPWSF